MHKILCYCPYSEKDNINTKLFTWLMKNLSLILLFTCSHEWSNLCKLIYRWLCTTHRTDCRQAQGHVLHILNVLSTCPKNASETHIILAYLTCHWKMLKYPNRICCLQYPYQIPNIFIFGIIVQYQCACKHTDCWVLGHGPEPFNTTYPNEPVLDVAKRCKKNKVEICLIVAIF